jgi:hypothetical protein
VPRWKCRGWSRWTARLRQRCGVKGGCTKGGGEGAVSALREAMAWHRGGWHRWRWRRRGVGVDGGDDDIEGGGGKSGSLTAQNQIFTMS